MKKFDVSKYEDPKQKDIDVSKTRRNVSVFLKAYQSSRTRVGEPGELINKSDGSINSLTSDLQDKNISEAAKQEFIELHDFFVAGFSAIQHYKTMKISQRNKKIFFYRFIKGMTIEETARLIQYSNDTVNQESAKVIIQFASGAGLLEYKK